MRMLRLVGELVIKVDKSTLYFRQELELLLQALSNVMGLLQGHICRQDNINLNKVLGPKGVGSDCVNVPDGLVVVPA